MQFDNSTPIYLQVIADIKKDIVNKAMLPGDKMLAGRDLALKYKINPNTAARVYQMLEGEGICYTKRGLGTFVSEDAKMIEKMKKEMAKDLVEKFLTNMRELGFSEKEILKLISLSESK